MQREPHTQSQSSHSNETVWAIEVGERNASVPPPSVDRSPSAPSSPRVIEVMEEEDIVPASPASHQTPPQSPIPASPASDQTPPHSPPPLPSITLPACRFCGNEEAADSLCVHWPPRCSALLCYGADCPREETCYCPGSGNTPPPQPPTHEEGMSAPGYYPVPGSATRALEFSLVKHETRTALVPNPTPHCPP